MITDTIRAEGKAMPLCDIAPATKIGYDACRVALCNAVRAKTLEIVGHEKRAHSKQWVALYDLPKPAEETPAAPAVVELQAALSLWR